MADDSVNENLIERLKQFAAKPNDNVEALRSVVARLHSRASSQDKQIRTRTLERLSHKNTGILPLLLTLLETVRDSITACSLAGILHDCVSPKIGKVRSQAIRQLIAMNATQSMVKLVKHQQQSQEGSHAADAILLELLWIIAQLAQRETKFSIKARFLGAVKTFHSLLRTYHNNVRMVFPILLVIKSLSKNPVTAAVLVKDGIVPTMEKTLTAVGLSASPKLRLALNVLSHLTKNKLCSTRVAKSGLVHLFLRLFDRWDRVEGKLKIRVSSYTLMCLQHVCATKVGRRAIRTHNGLQVLYKFSVACPEDKSYDALLSRVCGIINLCLDKKQLPVDVAASPAVFALPVVKDFTSDQLVREASSSRETSPGSDEDDEEDADEDDDDGGSQERDPDDDKGQFYAATIPIQQRDIEDLKEYNHYFREFYGSGAYLSAVRICKSSAEHCSKRGMVEEVSEESISLQNVPMYNQRRPSTATRLVTSIRVDVQQQQLQQQRDAERHAAIAVETTVQTTKSLHNNWQSATSVTNVKGLATLAHISQHCDYRHAYRTVASRVNSVLPFVKVAYPDMLGGDGIGLLEKLNTKNRKVCRAKLLTCVERGMHPGQMMSRVVYDLDQLSAPQQLQLQLADEADPGRQLFNLDEQHLGQRDVTRDHLMFESRFESGNLRKAIQIAPREYDLILTPDVNSVKHLQWFYFEVSNMEANKPYVFNIINCEKQNSQFNFGMKPLMYSVRESVLGHHGWVRTGSDICYYRNSYQNQTSPGKTRCYLTTTFTVHFQHAYDTCYFAYHYPYTYSQLMTQIWKWGSLVDRSQIYFRAESLCLSLNNNETPLLTITAPDTEANRMQSRETVFLSSRVHPGESNASWVMHGTLNHLLSDLTSAYKLRQRYVFKVVPVLNPEGVINGCHRCGLSDEDLNRRWSRPHPTLHPTIYHAKGLMDYSVRVLKKVPFIYCDYHGHSRRKNVFLYGCSNIGSWNEMDRSQYENPSDYLMLPHLMQQLSPSFSLSTCCFAVERTREATARVSVWREFGVKRSYTMESSYCGCDQGLYQGCHLDTAHLKEVGAHFCEAVYAMDDDVAWRMNLTDASTNSGSSTDSSKNLLYPAPKKRPEEADADLDDDDDSDLLDPSDSDDEDEDYHSLFL